VADAMRDRGIDRVLRDVAIVRPLNTAMLASTKPDSLSVSV
jgi:hypothetical protein